MKILILSFYYEPDLCAGSFRTTSFVNRLREKISDKDTITVLTTMPNRYQSYDREAKGFEQDENISIIRYTIPSHKSGMIDQSKSFFSYYKKTLKYTKNKDYDFVFATSSRLFTAYLGYKISKRMNLPLYLDIRDIFVDTLQSVFGIKWVRYLVPFKYLKYIEKKVFTYATKINIVSDGFRSYFKEIVPENKISFFSNGIDEEFLQYDYINNRNNNKKTIVYAGNIGDGQGLHKIIPDIAHYLGEEYLIKIVGAGGMRDKLNFRIEELKIRNVEIIDPVPRYKIINIYQEADYLFLHLNNYKAFEKVLPSKVFEYGATGKPVLAGVSGYTKDFITENFNNWLVFRPTDVNDFIEKFKNYKFRIANPEPFIRKFKRSSIMEKMQLT